MSTEITKTALNNGSLFIHTVMLPINSNLEEISLNDLIKAPDSTYVKSRLTKYALPISATFNLLRETGTKQFVKPVTHLRSRYAIIMCSETLNIPHSDIPIEIIRHLRINGKRQFMPIAQQDVLNMRLRDLVEITPDTKHMNFTFIYTPASFGKMRFLLQIEATLHQFLKLGFTEKDLDEVKGVFADTNLYLLCATLCIGSIHVSLTVLLQHFYHFVYVLVAFRLSLIQK